MEKVVYYKFSKPLLLFLGGMSMYDVNKIPKLPYGQGTISPYKNDLLIYKKTIIKPDGTKLRHSEYGKTPRECLRNMAEFEANLLQKGKVVESEEVLTDAMLKWLISAKKPTLKAQSYSRLESIINNQIEPSAIGHSRYQSVTTDDLQELIDDLNQREYSHSVIKKTYDTLNAFYRYSSIKHKFDNPMDLVVMPVAHRVNKEVKDIVWFEQDDIDKFIAEAGAKWNSGNPRYQGGLVYGANIYLGLRIGELLALQWEDIDFDNNTIFIHKTLIEEKNPKYSPGNNESKVQFTVQQSNKTSRNRFVPINSKAKQLLLEHYDRCQYTEPKDFVISTRNRKTTTNKNADDTIKTIQRNAETEVQGASSHCLRHTCASLYFRAGVPIETIARILGHSAEVCRNTYLHFAEEQLKEAASKITVFEI